MNHLNRHDQQQRDLVDILVQSNAKDLVILQLFGFSQSVSNQNQAMNAQIQSLNAQYRAMQVRLQTQAADIRMCQQNSANKMW